MKNRIGRIVVGVAASALALGGLTTVTANAAVSHSTSHVIVTQKHVAVQTPAVGFGALNSTNDPCKDRGYTWFATKPLFDSGKPRPDIGYDVVEVNSSGRACVYVLSGDSTIRVKKPMYVQVCTYIRGDPDSDRCGHYNAGHFSVYAGPVGLTPAKNRCVAVFGAISWKGVTYMATFYTTLCNT